jgi:hypothetical protein
MSRYDAMFRRLDNSGAFGAFVMLGDPDHEQCAEILDALVAGGADMIEVGIPFSDPIADGPTIQAAADRALANGTTTADCFAMLKAFRSRHADVPSACSPMPISCSRAGGAPSTKPAPMPASTACSSPMRRCWRRSRLPGRQGNMASIQC